MLSCNLFTANYPLLIEHVVHEAKSYLALIEKLDNRIDIESKDVMETELFWDEIMKEHALFIRGLLDPSEDELIKTANDFAHDFTELIEKARGMVDTTIGSITNETLNETVKFKHFKESGTEGIASCKIRSIILPLMADHVLREANHYIRLLENYKSM